MLLLLLLFLCFLLTFKVYILISEGGLHSFVLAQGMS